MIVCFAFFFLRSFWFVFLTFDFNFVLEERQLVQVVFVKFLFSSKLWFFNGDEIFLRV